MLDNELVENAGDGDGLCEPQGRPPVPLDDRVRGFLDDLAALAVELVLAGRLPADAPVTTPT